VGPSVSLEVVERSRTPVPLPSGSPLYRLSYRDRNFILKDVILGPRSLFGSVAEDF
jgi:hypothetical protein